MTPRDPLNRLATSFTESTNLSAEKPIKENKSNIQNDVTRNMAKIMADVSAISVEEFVATSPRSQPRRDPADALRWFVLSDAVALILGFAMAWVSSFVLSAVFLGKEFPFIFDGARVFEFCSIGFGVMFWLGVKGHYNRRKPFWMSVQQIIMAFGFAVIADGFYQFVSKQDFSRLWLLSGWVFALIFVVIFRSVVRRILRNNGKWQIRTLLVGSGIMAEEARSALKSEPDLGYDIVMQVENLPLLLAQTNQSWDTLCNRFNADYVVIALDGASLAKSDKYIAKLSRSGIPFSISPPMRHLPVLGMTPQYFFNHDVMLLTPVNNLEQPLPRFLKRSLDIVVSGLALLALSPLFLFLKILISRDGGNAFFGHERIGQNGKTFNCLKFRSMVLNGDEVLKELLSKDENARREWMANQKLQNDPRVTKIGEFIRRWSIDELPQLINVFKGDMSLVGPRPVVLEETKRYKEDIDLYYRVRPGLTGLWQVSGRSNVSFKRRVKMDSWYVRNWSLWHDIAIMFKTIPVVLNKTGAY